MLQKDCRFKDLSEETKQKLIQLQQKSVVPEFKITDCSKIDNFQSLALRINSLQSNALRKNFCDISTYLQNINSETDPDIIIQNIEKELKKIEQNLIHYNHSLENPMFLEELRDVYLTLSGKFMELKMKKDRKTFN